VLYESLERRIFSQAVGFHRIAHECLQLKDGDARDVSYMIAGIVNSAFAAELYMKCLIFLETGATAKTHDLHKLYKLLKPVTRADIEQRFDEKRQGVPVQGAEAYYARTGRRFADSFKDLITLGRDAFVEWRYLYEDSSSGLEYGLVPLPDILANLILEKKPEWRYGVWALG